MARRRRFWAGAIGALVGWGIAGLDGGVAGTVTVPRPSVEFVAAGTLTLPEVGTLVFDLAMRDRLAPQVMVIEAARLDVVHDREAGTLRIVDADAVLAGRHAELTQHLLEPFDRTAALSDAPLEILRDGVGYHLGRACERFRATGTADGLPVAVTACLTADGIPLTAELEGAGKSIRTELTALSVGSPDPEHFTLPGDLTAIDLTGG